MKSFLQTMTIVIALFLAFAWTGIRLPWYGAVFIGLAMSAYGIKNYYEGVRFGKRTNAQLSAEQFDVWLESHGVDPKEVARSRRITHNESN